MALLDLFSYACARASTARDGALARWSTRGVRPRSALAKAAVLCTVSFSFVLTLLRLRRRQCGHDPSPGGARGACAPYEHSQKQPCCALSLFCPRLSALYAPRYGARISPVEHAGRAPPMGTRKNALRRWRCSIFFLMPALVQARRGVGMFARWSTRGVRPRSALAKAAVLRTVSFSFVLTLLRLRRRQCAQMKNSP